MGDGYCPVLTLSGLVCRIDWPKLNVLHFKQEHRTLRRVTTEPPPEPPHPRTCPPCLAQVATPTLLRGPPQLAASFIPLPRQPPQQPPPAAHPTTNPLPSAHPTTNLRGRMIESAGSEGMPLSPHQGNRLLGKFFGGPGRWRIAKVYFAHSIRIVPMPVEISEAGVIY
jgi:hypothetical protein